MWLCTGFSSWTRYTCRPWHVSHRAPGRLRSERKLRAGAAWAKLASISQTVQGCHPRAPVGRKGCPPTTMALACVGIDGCFGDDVNSDETRGPETTIQAPAGTLGISFGSDDTSNVIIAVRPTSPLAGSVAVGDKLISIPGPGRAPFRCGGSTGNEGIGELRADARVERLRRPHRRATRDLGAGRRVELPRRRRLLEFGVVGGRRRQAHSLNVPVLRGRERAGVGARARRLHAVRGRPRITTGRCGRRWAAWPAAIASA